MEKITLNVPYQSISGMTKDTKYSFNISCNGITYSPIKELSNYSMVSKRTIERYLSNLKEKLREEEMWRYRILGNIENYISRGILFYNKKYRKNLNNEQYLKWLSFYTWDVGMVIGFEREITKDTARKYINNYWEKLKVQYPNKLLTLFYTTEKYKESNGYHLNAILGIEGKPSEEKIKRYTTNYFKTIDQSNVWFENLDERDFTDYILKEMHKDGDGHDFLSTIVE